MDWMYANCSTTAQRGALDWWKKFRDATAPVFNELYDSVAAGKESQRSIDSNSKADYREKLEEELKELRESELWQAGKTVRSLRPENQTKKNSSAKLSASMKEVFSKLVKQPESAEKKQYLV
jgi:ketol-acid reductoisomerase